MELTRTTKITFSLGTIILFLSTGANVLQWAGWLKSPQVKEEIAVQNYVTAEQIQIIYDRQQSQIDQLIKIQSEMKEEDKALHVRIDDNKKVDIEIMKLLVKIDKKY